MARAGVVPTEVLVRLIGLLALACFALAAACDSDDADMPDGTPAPTATAEALDALPDMPPVRDPDNIYADTREGMLAPAAERAKPLVYVPNSLSGTVSVIDPATYEVVRTFSTGEAPQHVTPSYDLTTLWATNNGGYSLTAIDPVTGEPGESVPVDDPYNLYFTPDGRHAIVVAEELERLDFRDPKTMELRNSVEVDCPGVNHLDFTADGRYAVASCEFSSRLLKLDVAAQEVVGYLTLEQDAQVTPAPPATPGSGGMPQDVRAAPGGRVFYVADMVADGVHLIDPVSFRKVGFIPTGKGTHSIIPSRDGRLLYVTNRGWNHVHGGRRGPGSISVLDPEQQEVVASWLVPDGGSPDMGAVTVDGGELWVSGRFDDEVYVFDTETGELTHRIAVGSSPHGLSVWPQPGRYSLGHNGNMR